MLLASKTSTSGASGKQKKLKTSSFETEFAELDLVALGTSAGVILLYSLTKGALHTQLAASDAAADVLVNDMAWCPTLGDALYSCASDGQLTEWSVEEARARRKWRGAKASITAIAVDSAGAHLVSASRTITVWNLKNKSKLKVRHLYSHILSLCLSFVDRSRLTLSIRI